MLPPKLRRRIGALRRRYGPRVVETAVGVKYFTIGFDSDRFQALVVREVPLVSSGLSFAELLLPPDMLKDRYASCGMPVLRSPHFRMIEEIAAGKPDAGSEYLRRSATGTLDNRLPETLSRDFLLERHRLFCLDLRAGKRVNVYAVAITVEGRDMLLIVDGKHRAAAAAVHKRPESVFLQIVSAKFVEDRFFQRVYHYTLKRNPAEYSMNQRLIRVLQHESRLA